MIIRRGWAFLFDFSLALIPQVIYFELFKHKNNKGIYVASAAISICLWISFYYLYFILMEYYWRQTIGKRIFGLKVVKADGSKLTFGDSVKRHLPDVIEAMFITPVAFFVMILNHKNRRVGD